MINLSMMSEWFATLINEMFANKDSNNDTRNISSREARFFESETHEAN